MGRTPVLPKWQFCKQPSAFPGSIPALFTLAPHPVHGACSSLEEALTVRRGQWGCRAGCPRPGADPSGTRASRPRDASGPASPSPHLQRLSHVPACHTSPPSPCLDTCPWPTCTTASLSENVPSYNHLPKKRVAMKSQPSKRGNILHGLRKVCNLGNKSFRSAYHILADSGKREYSEQQFWELNTFSNDKRDVFNYSSIGRDVSILWRKETMLWDKHMWIIGRISKYKMNCKYVVWNQTNFFKMRNSGRGWITWLTTSEERQRQKVPSNSKTEWWLMQTSEFILIALLKKCSFLHF